MPVTSISDLRERLKTMTPQQVRHIANMGRLHAKLAKKACKKHGLSVQEKALKDKLERTQCGLA